jgi:hypothetical protein
MCHKLMAALTAAVCLSLPTHAASISVQAADWQDDGRLVAIKLDGWIEAGDLQRILDAVREVRRKGLIVAGLEMQSPGGDVGTGMGIAAYVHKTAKKVVVREACWSSCSYAALVALAGHRLLVGRHAEIGLHRTYDTASGVPSPYWDNAVINMFKRYGVAPRAIKDMLATSKDSMTYYDLVELQKMGGEGL